MELPFKATVCTMQYTIKHVQFCYNFWFPFFIVQYLKKKQQKMLELLIYFIKGFNIVIQCVCWYSCNSVKKVTEHFAVFSNIVLLKKQTKMVVTGMTTRKTSLIWRHKKTLYWRIPKWQVLHTWHWHWHHFPAKIAPSSDVLHRWRKTM